MRDRREFLKTAAGSAAAAGFINWNPAAKGANERVIAALIGGRNQGRGVAQRAIRAGAEFKTFCDLDPAILEKTGADIAAAQGRKPQFETHFERVLEDKEIDAVVIAVPDHWHARIALLACQAGKDVYIEKPLCQTIQEGQLMREAARKYNRVVQVGTQRRSIEHFKSAAEFVASGKLGKAPLIKAWINQIRIGIGRPPASITTGGSAPRRSVPLTRTASTIAGVSSGTTATAKSAIRASTCSTSAFGRSN
jgi:predicted dehydrogenase